MHADAGAAADEPLGVHLCNILHILRMHDRFESIFQRWSVCRQRDRQQLVLTLAENAKLSHSVIAAICMLYPSRIAGPYVSKNVFTVELLDEAVHFEAQAEPALSHKRKRAAGEGEGAVEAIGSDVAQCLQSSNSSAVYVARTLTGQDGGGDWMTYELSASDRIDLSFMPNVYSGPNSDTIKVCARARARAGVLARGGCADGRAHTLCSTSTSRWASWWRCTASCTGRKSAAWCRAGTLCPCTGPRACSRPCARGGAECRR